MAAPPGAQHHFVARQARGGYEEAKSVAAATPPKPKVDGTIPKPTRTIPPLGPLQPLTWPTIEHAKLSNGIEIVYAHRNAVPLTQLALSFDAGGAADPVTQRGLGAMTLGLLEQGTTSLSAQQVAEAEERLGAEISASNDYDRSAVTLSALVAQPRAVACTCSATSSSIRRSRRPTSIACARSRWPGSPS